MSRLMISHGDVNVAFDIVPVPTDDELIELKFKAEWKNENDKDKQPDFNKYQMFVNRDQLMGMGLFIQQVVDSIDRSRTKKS